MRDVRVVIVEDHDALRRLLRLNLELAEGFEVVGEAADGVSGLGLVEELRPDVAVVDMRLPAMDGLSVVRALRRRAPEVRVVVFTGWADPRDRARALAAGADDFVCKSSDIAFLVRSIEAVGAACA